MSIWVKCITGEEQALKLDYVVGMDFADLKKLAAVESGLPRGAVKFIYSENKNEEKYKMKPGAKVPLPVDGEVGSSDDSPYYFYAAPAAGDSHV